MKPLLVLGQNYFSRFYKINAGAMLLILVQVVKVDR